ncbi:MAG: DNA adenine methylase [Microthrixaceae bacterium]
MKLRDGPPGVARLIKYIGSKRRLVPALGELCQLSGAQTALDLFCGTTRVAQEFKRRGLSVTAVDSARYAEVLGQCYIATDADDIVPADLASALGHLSALHGVEGYFTETFCRQSRFFQPHNGRRIDAIRQAIEDEFLGSSLYPILLTSLMEAADRVDSTTGVQMAYVKQWAPRSYNDLELRAPELLSGHGRAIRGDATTVAPTVGRFDLAYLDPPYNQHRYFSNYHIWETLIAWDEPEHYGVACKRIDVRDDSTRSVFNAKRQMPAALRQCIADVDARIVVLSYNNESWIELEDLRDACSVHGDVTVLGFNSQRYVGAKIGIHDPGGRKVGKVSHVRNVEYVLIAGPADDVATMAEPFGAAALA